MKWYEDYNTVLQKFETAGEFMDETEFYFTSDHKKQLHCIGCIKKFAQPYWVGYCDNPDGCEYVTAKEMFEAKIFDKRSIKDRWHELVMVNIGGIPADDYHPATVKRLSAD